MADPIITLNPTLLRKAISLLALLLLVLPAGAQELEQPTLTAKPTDGVTLGKEKPAEGGEKEVSYLPRIDGAVKARFEVSTYDGQYRFNVRNTRFGLSGNVTPHMLYRVQIDFHNEGKVSVQDAYAGYRGGGFEVLLGQQRTMFSTDLGRGPSSTLFVNRSMLSKFITSYYGAELVGGEPVEYVRAFGSRDLGLMGNYTWKLAFPLKFYFGLFNGKGANNPEWSSSVNLTGRIEAGHADKGLRLAAAYYGGTTPTHNFVVRDGELFFLTQPNRYLHILNVEARYTRGNFFVEGEYARRYLEKYEGGQEVLIATYIHSYYRFPMKRVVEYIAPLLRWDLADGVDYLNLDSRLHERFNANRITAGVNFGFGRKALRSEIRINYEKYLFAKGNKPSDLSVSKLLQDKFSLEAVIAF